MSKSRELFLICGLGLVFSGSGQSAEKPHPSAGQDLKFTLTIQVDDHANVDRKMLVDAEAVAERIFRKAGIEISWVNSANSLVNSTADGERVLSHIWVQIAPPELLTQIGLPNGVAGLAPGIGLDRQRVWVFYSRVKELIWWQMDLRQEIGSAGCSEFVSHAQILGTVLAHEIGHLLLNTQLHSKTGIMRANWDINDLCDMGYGLLLFTESQAEIIRADVARRQDPQKVALGATEPQRN